MIIPMLTVIVGLVLAIGVSAFTHARQNIKHDKLTPVYYKFIGTDDNAADQISNWTTITQNAYDNLSCPGVHRACALAASSTLTSVPFNQQSGYKDPKDKGKRTSSSFFRNCLIARIYNY